MSGRFAQLRIAYPKSRRHTQVLAASGTPHSTTIEDRKKELGVDLLKYSKAFMYQFAEVRTGGWQFSVRIVGAVLLDCVP